jgi:hypothetical protein
MEPCIVVRQQAAHSRGFCGSEFWQYPRQIIVRVDLQEPTGSCRTKNYAESGAETT